MKLIPIKNYLHNFEKSITTHGGTITDDSFTIKIHLRQWVNIWDYMMFQFSDHFSKKDHNEYNKHRNTYIQVLNSHDAHGNYLYNSILQSISNRWIRYYYDEKCSPLSGLMNESIPLVLINQKKLSEKPCITISVKNLMEQEETPFSCLIGLLAYKIHTIAELDPRDAYNLELKWLKGEINMNDLIKILKPINQEN